MIVFTWVCVEHSGEVHDGGLGDEEQLGLDVALDPACRAEELGTEMDREVGAQERKDHDLLERDDRAQAWDGLLQPQEDVAGRVYVHAHSLTRRW